jgi:hypothetical protein
MWEWIEEWEEVCVSGGGANANGDAEVWIGGEVGWEGCACAGGGA